MAQTIEKNSILEGPLWPEPVRVVSVETYGTMLQVDAVGTRSKEFYSATIITEDQLAELRISSPARGLEFSADAESFHLSIEAQRIRLAYEYDPHFAVSSSTITPLPHQLDAVYRYMLKSPLVRFLLADDPGAGKTIMAGLLLKELRFRGLAERVLIVVPPLITRQWQEELSQKFSEEFSVIDSGTLKANVGRNPWMENARCITSIYWAAREDVLDTLKEADWDLVIVDEAHKMAAYRQGVKSQKIKKTILYQLGEALSPRTKHLLLMTATPHKGDPENFRLLLELLDKDLFADRSVLDEAMKNQENPIILRRLKEEMRRFDGSALFPQRRVITKGFQLGQAEKELYNSVTEYVSEHFNKAMQKEKRNVGFAMMVLQRRLTSSVSAICASLERRHQKMSDLLHSVKAIASAKKNLQNNDNLEGLDEMLAGASVENLDDLPESERWGVEDSITEKLTTAESIAELEAEVKALEQLVRKARSARSTDESKYHQLIDAIIRDEGIISRGEKLLIFTEAKDTLDFLVKNLREQRFEVAIIDGSLSIEKRREQQEYFRNKAQIMLATEAGGESINLQFCNQMVNYDIPWNPNRLEQRMGRIHRIGQKNEVFIFNLVATDTREGEVLQTLLEKIEEMRKGLGSDRVFDLVGDLLDDHQISLSDLIIECITNRRKLPDAVQKIKTAVSPTHQKSLLAAREEGFARRFVNLPALRQDAARSAAHALLPAHLSSFFVSSLSKQRGRSETKSDGKLRIERVPVQLRKEQDINFRRRFGSIQASYSSVTFDKSEVRDDGKTELLGPGHPLFEAVLQSIETGNQEFNAKGATFFDVDIKAPERLWFFRASVGDGTHRTLSQRLFAVRELADGTFVASHPVRLYNLRPWKEGDPKANALTEFEIRKKAATLFCLQTLIPVFGNEIKEGRLKELGIKERYLERSFNVMISKHSDRLIDMELKSVGMGQDMNLAMSQERRHLEEAQRRRDERLKEIRQEQQLVTRAPEFLGVVAVLPAVAKVGASWASDELMVKVAQQEREQSRALRDTRAEDVGYDAISQSEDGLDLRFIWARQVENERVWLKASEWELLRHQGDSALLYFSKGEEILSLPESQTLKATSDPESKRVSIPV